MNGAHPCLRAWDTALVASKARVFCRWARVSTLLGWAARRRAPASRRCVWAIATPFSPSGPSGTRRGTPRRAHCPGASRPCSTSSRSSCSPSAVPVAIPACGKARRLL